MFVLYFIWICIVAGITHLRVKFALSKKKWQYFLSLRTNLSNAHEKPEVFMHLTDGIVQIIKGSEKPELKEAKEILIRIDRRHLYQELKTFEVCVSF